jgi:hypothetical protein
MMSLGHALLFRCDDQIIRVESGDVLVMDSMSVLHGVEGVVGDGSFYKEVGLPIPSRLGILFWQGRTATSSSEEKEEYELVDGIENLFREDDE